MAAQEISFAAELDAAKSQLIEVNAAAETLRTELAAAKARITELENEPAGKRAPVALAADEPRTVHHVRTSLGDRCNQLGELLGVVLKVGVLYNNIIASCFFNTCVQGCTFSFVNIMLTVLYI